MREYYAFRLQQRVNEGEPILRGGRLFHQFIVDAFTCIEEERLRWIRNNQTKLRAEIYSGLADAVFRGDRNAEKIGKRTILPSSYTAGPRFKVQNYQDAMAICRWAGYPDLFLTMTCNPKWPEIKHLFEDIKGQPEEDRPDSIVRVFQIRLRELMKDLKERHHFGSTIAIVYTIEFQKRGLPHAHILAFLHPEDKHPSPEQIDKIISAEIPDANVDYEAHVAVNAFMIHGPCGSFNPSAPCMKSGKCTKHYPKMYNCQTTIDADGFPVYRRRNDGSFVEKKGLKLDNRSVVPYNVELLVKHQSHINVEWCNRSRSIKYLFKYINKGEDRAVAVLSEDGSGEVINKKQKVVQPDEVKAYLDCRYISAMEACWRFFQFHIHYREPAVERLSFHMPNEQFIYFPDSANLENVLMRPLIEKTMLTEWMKANEEYEDARELTYVEFPTKWVWHSNDKAWKRRKAKRCIGRLYYAHPTSGEKYYLRMLLNIVKGPTSFQDIRTVNGVVYPTFKSACYALGFLDDDKEWIDCIHEASHWATGKQLRQLFATILLHCEVTDPAELWRGTAAIISEDILYERRQAFQLLDLNFESSQVYDYALLDIERALLQNGMSLKNYSGMPTPDPTLLREMNNRLLNEELNYDRETMEAKSLALISTMNVGQREIFNLVMESVVQRKGQLLFVNGHGGTGKTFLWKTIIYKLRSEGKIVLAVASSGIASLLLPGGKTAHSRFHIPLNVTSDSTCDIKQGTQLAELLTKTSLIIWDEAPMTNKLCFEALDRSLRDILRFTFEDSEHKPFGGMTMILGGDFRQIPPVVPRGRREQVVQASIKSSYLWKYFNV